MVSKVLCRGTPLIITILPILGIHLYARLLKKQLMEEASGFSKGNFEVAYKALVLTNFEVLTYLVLISSIFIGVVWGISFKQVKPLHKWLIGGVIALTLVVGELFFYKFYFRL